MAAGVFSWLGWTANLPSWNRFRSDWPPLAPTEAWGLIVIGFALRLRVAETRAESQTSNRPWLRLTPAFAALLLGLIGGAESLFGGGLTGMSPMASLDFAAAGAALALPCAATLPIRAAQVAALGIGFTALIAMGGFINGIEALAGTWLFHDVAFPSALSFAALALGLLCAQPNAGAMRFVTAATAGGRLLRRLIVPILLTPLFIHGLELAGERYGHLPAGFAWLLDAAIGIYLLGFIVWITARTLHVKDLERLAALEKTVESEERYRRLVEMSPDAIVVKNRERIEYANPAAIRLLGANHERDVVGQSALNYLHPDSRAELDPLLCSLLARGEIIAPTEQKIMRRDGSVLEMEVAAAAVDYGGRRVALMVLRDLTARNRAEQEARQLREQLELLVSAAPIVLYTCKPQGDFACTYISANIRAMLGYEPDDFLNYPGFWAEQVHPEDAPLLLSERKQVFAAKPGVHHYRFRHKQGTYRWLCDELRPVCDATGRPLCLVGYWQDITESRQAEDALRCSEELYRTTFDSAAVGVAHAALAGRKIVRANGTFAAITGYSLEELRQRTIEEITCPEDSEIDQAETERLLSGAAPSYRREKRYLRRDRSTVWVEVTLSLARDPAGAPEYIIAVASDITHRRELETALRHSQKMDAVGQLAGGVAHDFNNMLTAIQGHAQLMELDGTLPDSARESVREIQRAAHRAAGLTRQLLLFSRREVMQPCHLDLNETVTNLVGMLGRLLGERVRLQVKLHRQPLTVHADPGMIDQVLMNLAVNARDAMHAQGGDLGIALDEESIETPTIEGNPPGRYACLTVTDTGCGIAPDLLSRIFEPFFTTKEPGKGTGLGLAMVFGILKQHHGWITVQSEVGRGSTFRVYLPIVPPATPKAERRQSQTPWSVHDLTILLAEDEEAVRNMIRETLTGYGYKVLVAENGDEAVRLWRASHGEIDLLLTDIVMPGALSGHELAALLQAERPELPVLLISGYSPDVAGRPLDLPVGQAFLAKPFDPTQLLHRITEHLGYCAIPKPRG